MNNIIIMLYFFLIFCFFLFLIMIIFKIYSNYHEKETNFKNIICYHRNNQLQFERTFLNQNKIVEKINKKLKYIDFTDEKIDEYFLIFNKNIFKKMEETNNVEHYSINDFFDEIKEFINENNIKLTDVKKLIEENKNNEKHELDKKEQNKKEIHKKILTDYLNENNKKQQINNNQLDKLNNVINNIKG